MNTDAMEFGLIAGWGTSNEVFIVMQLQNNFLERK